MTLAERAQLARADEQMAQACREIVDQVRRPRAACGRCHQKKYAVRNGYCAKCAWLLGILP